MSDAPVPPELPYDFERGFIKRVLAHAPVRSEPSTELNELVDDLRDGRIGLFEAGERLNKVGPPSPADAERARQARIRAFDKLWWADEVSVREARLLKRAGVFTSADFKAFRKHKRERRRSKT